jgi:superfamily II DNA or RNA helicase
MISEGVDIPRLRVGVYATTTATELFFRQAVGRFVRWTRGVPRQRAWLFIPDDARLRLHAARIAEQRRHSLRRDRASSELEREAEAQTAPLDPDEQLSLFAVISAVATAADEPASSELYGDLEELDLLDRAPANEIELTLAPPPPLPGDAVGGERGLTRREEKQLLREANAEVARLLVRRTGLSHAQVNAELNRLAGVRRVSEATREQLLRRQTAAEQWLVKG